MKRILPFLIVLTLFLFGAHYAAYLMLSNAWNIFAIHNIFVRLFMVLIFSASFNLASVGIYRSMNPILRIFYIICAYWIGFFMYLFLGAVLWSVLQVFFAASSIFFAQSITLIALALFIYGAIHAKRIYTKMYEVALPNIPEVWKQKKVVMLSDLHLGALNNIEYAKKILTEIQKENPDIVFIVGDFFDGVKAEEHELAQVFSTLKPKDGVYFVMGNHEEFSSNAEKGLVLKNAGVTVLNNEKVEIDGVQIVGVDFGTTTKKYALENILEMLNIDRSKPSILLRHTPTHLEVAHSAGISLMLSGHTHNGQQIPGNYIASAVHEGYGYGLKKFRSMQVLVSSGIGTWGPPVRVGSQSELVILKFV